MCDPTEMTMSLQWERPGWQWTIARFLRLPVKAYVRKSSTTRETGRIIPTGEPFEITETSATGFKMRRATPENPVMGRETVLVREWTEFVR